MNSRIKRRYLRAPLKARVIVHDNQDFAYMKCKSISEGGMLLEGSRVLWTPGTLLKMNVKAEDIDQAFVVEGELINYVGKGKKGFCLKFLNISEDNLSLIREYVEDQHTNIRKMNMAYHFKSLPLNPEFTVFVGNKPVPQDDKNGWSYDPKEGLLRFRGEYVPEEGATIIMAFKHKL